MGNAKQRCWRPMKISGFQVTGVTILLRAGMNYTVNRCFGDNIRKV